MGNSKSKDGVPKKFRLTYRSVLNISETVSANQIIEDVLKVAEAFNPTKEIGGILYCNTLDGRYVIQLLVQHYSS